MKWLNPRLHPWLLNSPRCTSQAKLPSLALQSNRYQQAQSQAQVILNGNELRLQHAQQVASHHQGSTLKVCNQALAIGFIVQVQQVPGPDTTPTRHLLPINVVVVAPAITITHQDPLVRLRPRLRPRSPGRWR